MSMNKYTEAEQALNPNNDGTDVCLHAAATTKRLVESMPAVAVECRCPDIFCTLKQRLAGNWHSRLQRCC